MSEKPNYPVKEIGNIFKIIRKLQRATKKYLKEYRSMRPPKEDVIIEQSNKIRSLFKIFKGKYTLEIMHIIHILKEPYYNDIKNSFQSISSRILTDRLKLLEERDFVERIVHETQPVRVSYKLTYIGSKLYLIAMPLLFYLDSILPPTDL